MIRLEPEEQNKKEHNVADDEQQGHEQETIQKQCEDTAEDPYKDMSREELVALLRQKDEEIEKLNDKILRIAAEMDNTRKRLEREREEAVCYANEQILRELLPVIDNLERALSHAKAETDAKALLEGVEITLKGFMAALERFGCKPLDSVGKTFDPSYHEAVMQQATDQHPENTVIHEYQKGYILKDRLLRPAMVVVAKGSKQEKDEEK